MKITISKCQELWSKTIMSEIRPKTISPKYVFSGWDLMSYLMSNICLHIRLCIWFVEIFWLGGQKMRIIILSIWNVSRWKRANINTHGRYEYAERERERVCYHSLCVLCGQIPEVAYTCWHKIDHRVITKPIIMVCSMCITRTESDCHIQRKAIVKI